MVARYATHTVVKWSLLSLTMTASRLQFMANVQQLSEREGRQLATDLPESTAGGAGWGWFSAHDSRHL